MSCSLAASALWYYGGMAGAAFVVLCVFGLTRLASRRARGGCIINELPPIPRPVLHFGPVDEA